MIKKTGWPVGPKVYFLRAGGSCEKIQTPFGPDGVFVRISVPGNADGPIFHHPAVCTPAHTRDVDRKRDPPVRWFASECETQTRPNRDTRTGTPEANKQFTHMLGNSMPVHVCERVLCAAFRSDGLTSRTLAGPRV